MRLQKRILPIKAGACDRIKNSSCLTTINARKKTIFCLFPINCSAGLEQAIYHEFT